jgi:hypothetical protein
MTGFNRKIRLRGKVDEDRYFARLEQERAAAHRPAKTKRPAATGQNSAGAGQSSTGESGAPDSPDPDREKG